MLHYVNGRPSLENEEEACRCVEDYILGPCDTLRETTNIESLAEVERNSDGGTEGEEAEHREERHSTRWCLEQPSADAVEARSDTVAVHSCRPTRQDDINNPINAERVRHTDEIDTNDLLGPGNRVVHTYELLEQILLGLEPRDLLLMPSVCSVFQDVIATSMRIQDKFLMKLDRDPETVTWPAPVPAIFEMIELRWCFNAGFPNNKQPCVIARISHQQLGSKSWQQRASWRNLLLVSPQMKAVSIYASGKRTTGPLELSFAKVNGNHLNAGKVVWSTYRVKMRSQEYKHGVRLGDLVDMAHRLHRLDEGVTVQFSTYLNPNGEACLHEWEEHGMLPFDDVMEVAGEVWQERK